MSKNKESKGNSTIIQKLEEMGMKMTPDDHPIYTMNHTSIRFISKSKKGDYNE